MHLLPVLKLKKTNNNNNNISNNNKKTKFGCIGKRNAYKIKLHFCSIDPMAACQSHITTKKARFPVQEVTEMHFQGSITGSTDSRDDYFSNARADRYNLSAHNKKYLGRFQEKKKAMHPSIQFRTEPHTT